MFLKLYFCLLLLCNSKSPIWSFRVTIEYEIKGTNRVLWTVYTIEVYKFKTPSIHCLGHLGL